MILKHEQWMNMALREAQRAFDADEVPVGAIVVHKGEIIGRGYNQREQLQDPTAHAEMIAITAAANSMHSRRLENCTLYVTLNPAPCVQAPLFLPAFQLLCLVHTILKQGLAEHCTILLRSAAES